MEANGRNYYLAGHTGSSIQRETYLLLFGGIPEAKSQGVDVIGLFLAHRPGLDGLR